MRPPYFWNTKTPSTIKRFSVLSKFTDSSRHGLMSATGGCLTRYSYPFTLSHPSVVLYISIISDDSFFASASSIFASCFD